MECDKREKKRGGGCGGGALFQISTLACNGQARIDRGGGGGHWKEDPSKALLTLGYENYCCSAPSILAVCPHRSSMPPGLSAVTRLPRPIRRGKSRTPARCGLWRSNWG